MVCPFFHVILVTLSFLIISMPQFLLAIFPHVRQCCLYFHIVDTVVSMLFIDARVFRHCFYLEGSFTQEVLKLVNGAVVFLLFVNPHLVNLEDSVRLVLSGFKVF